MLINIYVHPSASAPGHLGNEFPNIIIYITVVYGSYNLFRWRGFVDKEYIMIASCWVIASMSPHSPASIAEGIDRLRF